MSHAEKENSQQVCLTFDCLSEVLNYRCMCLIVIVWMIVIQHNSLLNFFALPCCLTAIFMVWMYIRDGGLLDVDCESTARPTSKHQGIDMVCLCKSSWCALISIFTSKIVNWDVSIVNVSVMCCLLIHALLDLLLELRYLLWANVKYIFVTLYSSPVCTCFLANVLLANLKIAVSASA